MTDYKSMFEQAVRTLAAIDEALGIGEDGCGDPDQTLTAIAELKEQAAAPPLQTPFDTCPTCEALARTADKGQFNILADCRDLLLLAAHEKRDAGVQAVCELAGVALLNIKDRYIEKERMGATGEELKALQALVDVSRDFWMRQSGELFRSANLALDQARGFVRERVAA